MWSRRQLIVGSIASVGLVAAPAIVRAQSPVRRPPTPSQTEGPYYPVDKPADSDNDLVIVRGQATRAQGVVTHIGGRILDRDGQPIEGAVVEIWQCDANGLYRHPRDRPGERDGAFQGFGRSSASSDGAYAFRTIRPVPYPGRTPHIHFRINTPARRLTTQMYVAGEPLNDGDIIYRGLDRVGREAVTVRLVPANGIEDGALAGEFNIIV
jgi:protocatechuate 3,4-dioxygenase beta subunit